MPRHPDLFGSSEHPQDRGRHRAASPSNAREPARTAALLGDQIRAERMRRRLTLRDIAAMSGLALGTVHAAESGQPCELRTYVRIAGSLHLRPEFALVDPRRREGGPKRRADLVHAAMGEAQAARLRRHRFTVRMDEPYQHYQFAGRADLVAWSQPQAALLHVENRTEFPDVQDAFGAFNAKRVYLGPELAERAGVTGWRSETHVVAALWSADALRSIRRHRASFESVCPDPPDPFEQWWAGTAPERGYHSTLVLFDPVEGKRSDRRRWVGLTELDGLRPRYRDYADAAARIVAP